MSNGKNNIIKCSNQCETLGHNIDDDDVEDENDESIEETSSENGEEKDDEEIELHINTHGKEPTREKMCHEVKILEQVIDVKTETIETLKVQVDRKAEIRNLELKLRKLK